MIKFRRARACLRLLEGVPTEVIESQDLAAIVQAIYEFQYKAIIPAEVCDAIRALRRRR